jgi:hypothetical protein
MLSVAPELNYSNPANLAARYRVHTINPVAAPVLALNSTSEMTFQIPPVVHNLSQSRLEFDIQIPAQKDDFTFGLLNPGFIHQIELNTQSGINLCNIVDFRSYVRGVMPYTMSYEEWRSDNRSIVQPVNWLPRCDEIGTAVLAAGVEAKLIDSGGGLDDQQQKWDGISVVRTAAADNTAFTVNYSCELGRIPHTIFSQPADLYFANEQLVLRVVMASGVETSFAADDNVLAGKKAATTVPVISNARLQVAYQDNADVAAAVKEKVLTSGLEFNIQYPWLRQETTDATTSYNRQWSNLNASLGSNLLAVYTVPTRQTGIEVRYNNNSFDTAMVTSFRNFIDNLPLQDGPRTEVQFWQDILKYIEGSVITNSAYFRQNLSFVQNFTSMKLMDLANTTPESGISLMSSRTYEINFAAKVGAALQVFNWFIVSRKLRIGPGGVSLLSM